MFDVVEYSKEHLLFWYFVAWAHFILVCTWTSALREEESTIVDDAIHVQVKIIKPSS